MDSNLNIYDLTKSFKQIHSFKTKSNINYIIFSEKNNFLCTANSDNDVDIYDLKKARVVFKLKNH